MLAITLFMITVLIFAAACIALSLALLGVVEAARDSTTTRTEVSPVVTDKRRQTVEAHNFAVLTGEYSYP